MPGEKDRATDQDPPKARAADPPTASQAPVPDELRLDGLRAVLPRGLHPPL
jgi:hypothetical protein